MIRIRGVAYHAMVLHSAMSGTTVLLARHGQTVWHEPDPATHHFPGGTILVIAHGTLIRLLLCTVLGMPLRDYRRRMPRVDSVALTELPTLRTGRSGSSPTMRRSPAE
jgi:broad specificity phosphatase PhoE